MFELRLSWVLIPYEVIGVEIVRCQLWRRPTLVLRVLNLVETLITINALRYYICFIVVVDIIVWNCVCDNFLAPLVVSTLDSLPFLFENRVHNYLVSMILLVNVWLEIHVHGSPVQFIIILVGLARFEVAKRPFMVVVPWLKSWFRVHIGCPQVKTGVAVDYLEGVSWKLLLVKKTGVIDASSCTVLPLDLGLVGGHILITGAHDVKLPNVLESLADR